MALGGDDGGAASCLWVPASRVTGVSTALYRRYRPETFAEVIGQDHVTAPLMQALRSGRENHAYLFSGPHGVSSGVSGVLRSQLSVRARMRALVVLPHPRGPENR